MNRVPIQLLLIQWGFGFKAVGAPSSPSFGEGGVVVLGCPIQLLLIQWGFGF
jgi:hypothetical protein